MTTLTCLLTTCPGRTQALATPYTFLKAVKEFFYSFLLVVLITGPTLTSPRPASFISPAILHNHGFHLVLVSDRRSQRYVHQRNEMSTIYYGD